MYEVTTADPGQAWQPHSVSHSLQDWKEKYIHENYTKALEGKLVETVGGVHNAHLLLWEYMGVELQYVCVGGGEAPVCLSVCLLWQCLGWIGLFPCSIFQLRSVDTLRRTELLGMMV